MDNTDLKWLLAILVVVAAAGAGWYFRNELLTPADVPGVTLPEPTTVEAIADDGPEHPITPYRPTRPEHAELVPLPALDDSDGYFLLALIDVLGAEVESLLVTEALIDKFVATVDNLPRKHVTEKIRPVGRLTQAFRVDTTGNDEPVYLSPRNYQRYDLLVNQIASADINAVVDTYRRFYPLLQQSYERLGYPDAYFNDRVVEVIDHLLATPQPEEPIRVIRPHVLFEFADPKLESLSSGQKLLLRMGSGHAAVVMRVLRELRVDLASH